MRTFDHILVPTDFGEAAARALDLAISLATTFDSKLTLLHVYTIPASAYGYANAIYWPVQDLARAAELAMQPIVEKARERLPRIESALACGEPWREIVGVIDDRKADLVVMGTHGRHGLSRVFLGSVAEKVVRFSPVPVLTISSGADRKAKLDVLAEERKDP